MDLDQIHHESLQQLLSKVRPQAVFDLIPGVPLSMGDTVEIQGASGSGKTHFLYAAVMNCIASHGLGGWNKAAVVFDSDNAFDLNRLIGLLRSRIVRSMNEDSTSDAIQIIVNRSLESLHIFRPKSSAQLASSILHLPAYHSTHLSHHEIGLIAIDSSSAFYWQDRFTMEQLQQSFDQRYSAHRPAESNPLRHVLIAVERLRVLYRPLILFTNWGLNYTQASGSYIPSNDVKYYKQHLPHPFPSPFAAVESGNFGFIPLQDKSALSLTHHITLNIAPTLQSHRPADPGADTMDEPHTSVLANQMHMLEGAVRIPGVPEARSFNFTIKADGLSFSSDPVNP